MTSEDKIPMTPKEIVCITIFLAVAIWFVVVIIQFFVWAFFGVELITTAHPVAFWIASILVSISLVAVIGAIVE